MKRAIVTGATGFIGSWLVRELLKNHIDTTVIVRNKSRLLSEAAENPHCVILEKELDRLEAEDFEEKGYDAFFHLAWEGVSPEKKNDTALQLKNISLSVSVLKTAYEIGCGKFIASGTVAEYALCKDVMNVHAKQTPNDMYGAAKASAYYFLEMTARQLGQPFIWMIIPSTFGPRRTDNNIITYTIRSLLNRERPSYGDLTQMWDFLYVEEVVRAIRMIGEYGIPDKIYGIGSGQYRPLRSYVEEIRDIIDPESMLGIGERPARSGQTFSSCVNIYDLVADTGFVPTISFTEGIRMTIRSFVRGGVRNTHPFRVLCARRAGA